MKKFSKVIISILFIAMISFSLIACKKAKSNLVAKEEEIVVSWESETSEDFKSYYLSVQKVGTGNIIEEKTITNVDTTTFTFSSLSSETKYEIVFKINYKNDKPSYTEKQVIQTLSKA